MTAYFRLWSALALLLLLLAVALNYFVDPYGLYRPEKEGEWKPHAGVQGELAKTYQVLRQPLGTLILGNSRAEVGFDPQDTVWSEAARPVFNLGIPGKGPRAARRLFEHVLAYQPPRSLILGVDFLDFPVEPQARDSAEPALASRLLRSPDGSPNSGRWLQVLHDRAATLASLDAVIHSLNTVRQWDQAGTPHLTQEGFNPMHDYRRMAEVEGYFNLFRQRDKEYARSLARKPRNLFLAGTRTSFDFEDVNSILNQARARHIPVHVVIYPYHAHLLESMRMLGYWELFEDWKRELVRLAGAQGQDVRLWDFSGYHDYATEAAPKAGDRKTEVRWYWEAGHFQKELGRLILERIQGGGDPGFGQLLMAANLEEHLGRIREDGRRYRQGHGEVVSGLGQLAQ